MVCGVIAVCHGGVPGAELGVGLVPYSVIWPPGQLNCTASGPVRPWLAPMSMSMSWTRAWSGLGVRGVRRGESERGEKG
eukprot:scaffold77421_cov33-Phaeocystis_antarctica.AAC.1